jgi:hypothetical protein
VHACAPEPLDLDELMFRGSCRGLATLHTGFGRLAERGAIVADQ